MGRRLLSLSVAVLAFLASLGVSPAAAASPGTIELTVSVPEDAVALIEVDRVDGGRTDHMAVVHHGDDGPLQSLSVAAGTYRVTPRVLTVGGTRYVAAASPRQVRVTAGGRARSTVSYAPSLGVQNLAPTELTSTTVALDWDAELGDDTIVRRVLGDTPSETPGRGAPVALEGSSFRDTGLQPGTTYSYSIFARPGDGRFGSVDGDPVTFTVGTPSGVDAVTPSFVTAPGTVILDAADLATVRKVGTGILVTLAQGLDVPLPGSVVSLPVTADLEGGYLGEVVDVSPDGRTVLLTQAAMGQAFDFYHLPETDVDDAVADVTTAQATTASVAADAQARTAATRAARQGSSEPAQVTIPRAKALAPAPQSPSASTLASSKVECAGISGASVTPHFSTSHAGHAEVTVDKYQILFVSVPSGVGVDLGYTATATGTIDVSADLGIDCSFPMPRFYKQVTAYPVPLAVMAEPVAEVGLSTAASVENLGFAVTAGFEASGHLGFTGTNYADGSPILSTTPTQPSGSSATTLSLAIGGEISFGPGVGTTEAGVIAGLGGELRIVDASLGVVVNEEADVCLRLDARTGFGVYLTARAWVVGYDWDYRLQIDPLTLDLPWGGSPWYWPNDCDESDTPTDDVVGPGVTPIGDDLTGSDEQWGKVEGFVPGQSTWVLSTGRVNDAVGEPSFFASTGMGRPGLPELSALVGGGSTYDAARFTVTVVPNEDTLHVRYAFASEEYPEYVGSQYNDVMAVFVDGQNCAYVPETQTAVSINSVNDHTNAQYYVDNAAGASGYGTSMDGLTTPLTCSVPVTPGEQVTVSIAVADVADDQYDSAVALVDGGIWSD